MIAADYIQEIPQLTSESAPKECIEIMYDNMCFELPVFRDGQLIGTVELDECIHTEDLTIEHLIVDRISSVYTNTHLFDVLHIFNETKANTAAVLDETRTFHGILTKTDVLEAFAHSLSVDQDGAIVVLEMASHQYSSSEITRIIEGEGSQVLGLWLHNIPESGRIRASIKLNIKNAERIIGSLRRFNYEVIASFGDEDHKENVERRFQSLMKYLDI